MYYEEVFKELNKRDIQYLVVGGIALVLHGVVRLTVDLDLFLKISTDNLTKLVEAMKALGYRPKAPVNPDELTDASQREIWRAEKNMKAFSFYDPREPYKLVDIFIYEPIDFEDAYHRKEMISAGGLDIPVVSTDDLKQLKRISGREQDLADIEAIEELEGGNGST